MDSLDFKGTTDNMQKFRKGQLSWGFLNLVTPPHGFGSFPNGFIFSLFFWGGGGSRKCFGILVKIGCFSLKIDSDPNSVGALPVSELFYMDFGFNVAYKLIP